MIDKYILLCIIATTLLSGASAFIVGTREYHQQQLLIHSTSTSTFESCTSSFGISYSNSTFNYSNSTFNNEQLSSDTMLAYR